MLLFLRLFTVIQNYFRSYNACMENEKWQGQFLEFQSDNEKKIMRKEFKKVQNKCTNNEILVKLCDKEYYASAINSERLR